MRQPALAAQDMIQSSQSALQSASSGNPAAAATAATQKLKEAMGTVQQQLGDEETKQRILQFMKEFVSVLSSNKLGILLPNVEAIPSPTAFQDAYFDTLAKFLPKFFPDSKFAPIFLEAITYYRQQVRKSDQKLLATH